MGKQVLSILVISFAYVHLGNCAIGDTIPLEQVMRSLGGAAGVRSGYTDFCTITKPEDTCKATGPPACISDTCSFVPEYGEEITSLWQIFLDGYSSIFNYNKKKKYRRILDLGEKVTKSFDGEVCKNENTICDCTAADPADCTCDNKDKIKVCKQKYTNKFSLYYVYNFFFCEPQADPWALLFKQLTGGQRHLSYADTRNPPYHQPPYNPYSQNPSFTSIFKYIQLLKKDKHNHLGNLVICEEQPAYTPPRSPYYKPHSQTPDYHKPAYMQNPKTMVRHAFLKVKVPSGCECEEL